MAAAAAQVAVGRDSTMVMRDRRPRWQAPAAVTPARALQAVMAARAAAAERPNLRRQQTHCNLPRDSAAAAAAAAAAAQAARVVVKVVGAQAAQAVAEAD